MINSAFNCASCRHQLSTLSRNSIRIESRRYTLQVAATIIVLFPEALK